MTYRTDAERAPGEPIGVFVRLPFLGTERDRILKEAEVDPDRVEEVILAVGTPITGAQLEVVGYSAKLANSFDKVTGEYTNFDIIPRLVGHSICLPPGSVRDLHSLVRHSDALAKIAEKDAEVAQLRNLLARFRDVVSRGLAQSQTLPGEKYPIGSPHHPVWVEIASALEVPEDSHD